MIGVMGCEDDSAPQEDATGAEVITPEDETDAPPVTIGEPYTSEEDI